MKDGDLPFDDPRAERFNSPPPERFNPPPPPDPITLARSTDPETSHEAAWSLENATKVQARILWLHNKWRGYTDEELRVEYRSRFGPTGESSVRSRRHDLVGHGLVEDTGVRRALKSGRDGIVWSLTWLGRVEASKIQAQDIE